MTDPMTQEDPILAKAKQLREAGATIDEVKQYLAAKGYATGEPTQASRGLSRAPVSADASVFRAPGASKGGDLPVLARGVASNVLSAAQAIPGMEAFEAGMGSLGSKFTDNPMGYRESLAALRSETDAIPGPIKLAGQLPVAAKVLPQSLFSSIPKAAATSGALGAAHGLAQADPDAGIGERVKDAAVGGSIGAAVPILAGGAVRGLDKAREFAGLANRVRKAPSLGGEATARRSDIVDTDRALYGAAEREAVAGGGTSPKIQAVLQHPRVQPLADDLRESLNFIGDPSDDASLILQLHRELSQKQGPMVTRLTGAPQGQPLTERQIRELGKIKEMLRDAGSELMPSFPSAVAEHAEGMGGLGMMQEGAERGRNLVTGKRTPVKKLVKGSPEGSQQWALRRSPEEAEAALTGALSSGKEALSGALPNGLWAGGGGGLGLALGGIPGAAVGAGTATAIRAGIRLNRLAPFVQALDQQAGNPAFSPTNTDELLRLLGISTAVTNK